MGIVSSRKNNRISFNTNNNSKGLATKRKFRDENVTIEANAPTPKRGRPKIPSDQRYANTRKKFTAMLEPYNYQYLKDLKSSKKIKSVSAFLDILVEEHRLANSDNPIAK